MILELYQTDLKWYFRDDNNLEEMHVYPDNDTARIVFHKILFLLIVTAFQLLIIQTRKQSSDYKKSLSKSHQPLQGCLSVRNLKILRTFKKIRIRM